MIEDTVLLTQLPSDGWFEGFSSRPNGQILVTRLDEPELYTLNVEDPNAEPQLLYTFPEANGLVNLCPLSGCHDEYAVVSSIVDLNQVTFDTFIVWRVVLSANDSTPPTVTKIAELNDFGLAVGVIPASERMLLIADATKFCIRSFSLLTGESSLILEDDTMKAASKEEFWGMNRLRIAGGFLWYTNTSIGTLCRVPIELDEKEGMIRTKGPVEVITKSIPHCDGLAVTDDATEVYTANYQEGLLWKVDLSKRDEDAVEVVMDKLVSPTAVELVQGVDGKPKLFVVCCGEIDIGWKSDDRASWSDMVNVMANVTISVTTEVVDG